MTTFADVKDAIQKLVEANPEFVYESPWPLDSCVYVYDNEGSCLVGQALIAVGFKPSQLRPAEFQSAGDVVNLLGIWTDELDWDWVNKVQEAQDSGQPWKDCVHIADTEVYGA